MSFSLSFKKFSRFFILLLVLLFTACPSNAEKNIDTEEPASQEELPKDEEKKDPENSDNEEKIEEEIKEIEEKDISSIDILQGPTNTYYWLGDEIDLTGLKIKYTDSKGVSETLTYTSDSYKQLFTITNYDKNKTGEQKIVVTFKGQQINLTVTVRDIKSYAIIYANFTESFTWFVNDKFDPSNKKIHLTLQNGDDYIYTDVSYEAEKDNFTFPQNLIFTEAGEYPVNFTYRGLQGKLNIIVASKGTENNNENEESYPEVDLSQYTIQSVYISYASNHKKYYNINEEFDPTGITIEVIWANENNSENPYVYKTVTYESGNSDFEFPSDLVFDKEETKNVEFKYKGFSCSVEITVEDNTNTDIKCRYDETTATLYFYADSYPVKFDYSALSRKLNLDGSYPWTAYQNTTKKIVFAEGIKNVSLLFDFPLLEEIEFSSTLEEVDNFNNCPSLISIEIPATVKTLCASAFSNNKNLTTVKFNKGIKKIESGAFSKCPIKKLEFPEGLEVLSCNIDKYNYPDLESLIMPDDVKVINSFRIMESNIKNIKFSNTAEYKGEFVIGYCNNLEELKLPDSLTVLDGSSVLYCENLKKIYVGKSLKTITIPNSPFSNLPALNYFYYNAVNCVNYVEEENSGVPLFRDCGNQDEGIEIIVGKDVKRLLRNMVGSSNNDNQSYFKNISFEEGSKLEIIEENALNTDFMDSTLELPDSVSEIKGDVKGNFKGRLIIPSKLKEVPSFWGNHFTGDLIIPDTVTKITSFGLQEFDNVYISKNVEDIPDYCFKECKIKSIDFSNINIIGKEAFDIVEFTNTNLELPESVTIIEDSAFRGSNISKIKLPKTMVRLGSGPFWGCENLTEVVMPESLEIIPEEAFAECRSLKTINNLPQNLKKIEAKAFENTIVELKMSKFPDTLEYIGEKAFYPIVNGYTKTPGHNYNEVIVPAFPAALKYIGNEAFSYYFYNNATTDVVFPENMTYLSGFDNCAFKSIKIGAGTKEIGKQAFSQTSTQSMTTLVIPEGVETIGEQAFFGMIDGGSRGLMLRKITSIEFPSTLTLIKTGAFCVWAWLGNPNVANEYPDYVDAYPPLNDITSIILKSTTPPVLESVSSLVLQGIKSADKTKLDTSYNPNPKIKVYVPVGSRTNYTSADASDAWKIGTEIIELN